MERKFTELEIKIMKNLYHNGARYIVRDKNGDVFSCDLCPTRRYEESGYLPDTDVQVFSYISKYITCFNAISSDDNHPVCIEEELKNYEEEYLEDVAKPYVDNTFTKDELSVMKILYDNGAKYLARNYDGILRWYNLKPQKMDGKMIKCWDAPGLSSNGSLNIFSNAFSPIASDNDEPTCISKSLLDGGYSLK